MSQTPPLELTAEQIASIYVGSLDSVHLLKMGQPIGSTDWVDVEARNRAYLESLLAKDYWTTEDLTPLQDAVANESPSDVQATPAVYDVLTHSAAETYPVKVDGVWVQQWVYTALTPAESDAVAQRIKQEITVAVQTRLDDFAKTRDYDNVLSACSYATSSHAKYGVEGQYCVAAREATWDAMYAYMAEVVAGTRPMPTGYVDIEPLLPALNWPA